MSNKYSLFGDHFLYLSLENIAPWVVFVKKQKVEEPSRHRSPNRNQKQVLDMNNLENELVHHHHFQLSLEQNLSHTREEER